MYPRSVFAALLILGISITGCSGNHYEIELVPTDGGIERSLTGWRSDSSEKNILGFPDDELQQIAAAYNTEVSAAKDGKHYFAKVFSQAMPQDVGGSGSYHRWETSLGSLSIYVERFRGDDDYLAEVEKRLKAVDRIVDLLNGWLSQQLQGAEGVERLSHFLDSDFRRDLKNFCVHAWVAGLQPEEDEWSPELLESLLRAGHYLMERDYFSVEQIPEIVRAVKEQDATGHSQRLLSIVQRSIAAKMGFADPERIPDCLNFLGHELAINKSVDSYLSKTEDYAELLRQWEAEKAVADEAADLERPEPAAVISQQLTRAFLPTLFAGSDTLDVTLAAKKPPFATNGQWDGDNNQVRWERTMLGADADLFDVPDILFALWCEPNLQAQLDQFGKTILDRDALAHYCLWHRSLNEGEAEQWESFLSSLSAGDRIASQLRQFRFSHEPPAVAGGNENEDLAATARDLIIAALAEE